MIETPATMKAPYWWPLALSERQREAISDYRERMQRSYVALDREAVARMDGRLTRAMNGILADIIERDGLPHLCHVINGWGNARYRGRTLLEGVTPFIHRDAAGRPFILQCDNDGDYHPWQTFAYAVMAGVDPDLPIPPTGATLRQLALHSRFLNTDKGHELGHLLFALADVDPDVGARAFSMSDQICDVQELMDRGVEAHHFGPFDVCRKFHLTEGLVAMVARVPELAPYHEDARGFLDGQMDMGLLLGVIFEESGKTIETGREIAPDSLLRECRNSLAMGDFIENHIYYVGHLVEMAAFAVGMGFPLAPLYHNMVRHCINEINNLLAHYLPYVDFHTCFLQAGHLRRAVTLWLEVERAGKEGHGITREDLARYTIDFDACPQPEPKPRAPLEDRYLKVYCFDEVESAMRPFFAEVIDAYSRHASPGMKPRGRFDHFRRIGPPSWPRALHYELLDYGNRVGAEIHLESDLVASGLRETIEGLAAKVQAAFPERPVDWDEDWSRQRGRLRVSFEGSTSAEVLADCFQKLIDLTFPVIDPIASTLVDPEKILPGESVHHEPRADDLASRV
ncbi:MAG: hypothetical protein QNK37_31055 [Acidobacteriota bacterium]|nr:hypothetical protein [Acidobacteriota bacterium]